MACEIKERKLFQKLTDPIGYGDQVFTEKFYHTLVKEPDLDLPGGNLYALMNFGNKLPYFDSYYVEYHQGYKVTHDWRELPQTQTEVDFRHTQVKMGWRRQKCRITYSSSFSYYPRAARNHPDQVSWNMQNEANLYAFLQAFKIHDTYKMLKIFRTSDEIKKIIGENSKCNYFSEIVEQIEHKDGDSVSSRMYYRTLQERYNNAKGASPDQGVTPHPLGVKSDGTYSVTASDTELFKVKNDPTKDILECIHKIIYSNKVTATKSTKNFLDPIADDEDKNIIGLIDKVREIIKTITSYPRTEYNLAHNAADVSKCAEDVKDSCKTLQEKYNVEFMNCCCKNDGEDDKCCFCELPKIKSAQNLRIIINPNTMHRIDSIAALCPNFKGYEMIAENFYGVQVVEDICYPEGKVHIYEIGAIEFMERYNQENNETYNIPDVLQNKIRHIELECILRFDKVAVAVEKPT